jgi:prepilin-type N-terminal cleavage/methylation domain-containing protein
MLTRIRLRRCPQGTEGFTLLEVLVATALMGVVLVVLLQVLTSAIRAQEAAQGHMRALLVAEKVLQENCGASSLAASTHQGRVGGFNYLVRVTPQYELSNPQKKQLIMCSLIQVTVSWQERGQTKSLALETIRTMVQKKA